jgi:O-methyltransferase/aklanonic acid methyltransferase
VDDHKAWLAGVFDRAAPTYDRIGEAYHTHFAERLIDLTAPARDAQLLDVACGRGAVLVAAAARGIGRLAGIDVSPTMIELARADLRAAGVTQVDLRVMDAEHLDFPAARFDVLTAAFALFFLPDPRRAAAEFRRVLRPGGVLAVSTWGDEDERGALRTTSCPPRSRREPGLCSSRSPAPRK